MDRLKSCPGPDVLFFAVDRHGGARAVNTVDNKSSELDEHEADDS